MYTKVQLDFPSKSFVVYLMYEGHLESKERFAIKKY